MRARTQAIKSSLSGGLLPNRNLGTGAIATINRTGSSNKTMDAFIDFTDPDTRLKSPRENARVRG